VDADAGVEPGAVDTIVLIDKAAQFSGTVPVARMLLAAAEQRMGG